MKRIESLDGLRTCAVLGVIWAHVWMFFGNLPFVFAGVDINRILSFGGIGVDLFFVISGFCMYLMHSKQTRKFSFQVYKEFILKRLKRIAPAFYFIVLFECIGYFVLNGIFPAKSFLSHLFFVNTFVDNNVLSPPFWSLATEWHFYLFLPFIFIHNKSGKFPVMRVIALIVICMVFRVVLYHQYDLSKSETVASDRIWYRFPEFGFGILAAWFYTDEKKLINILNGNLGFLITLAIAFSGRLLMTTDACKKFGNLAFVTRACAEPLLTFGFALMVLNLLNSESIFRKIISSKFFLFTGRISYSMYLWHWIIAVEVSSFFISAYKLSALNMEMAFIATVSLVIPVAFISYKVFEEPYFKKTRKKKKFFFWALKNRT
ncbi:MAG: acyltransferase [Bacteroidetes bacterium]|nr:acyltransferase [Bacteroidota bacterium]